MPTYQSCAGCGFLTEFEVAKTAFTQVHILLTIKDKTEIDHYLELCASCLNGYINGSNHLINTFDSAKPKGLHSTA